jgi:hypothetical protein
MNEPKKAPRWTVAFIRALERTGDATASAADAGVDKSTAYARRKAHPDFAQARAEALERFRAEKKKREKEEIAAFKQLLALRRRKRAELTEHGLTYDEQHDLIVSP